MELKIDRENFFKCVSRVQSIIERRSNMPILSTILLTGSGSELHISATDLELGFLQIIPAQIIEEGSITVSGRKLFEILKESKTEKFHLKEKENNRVFMSDGIARFELAFLPADEYPSFVEPEDTVFVQIDGHILEEMINKTIHSVTREDAGFKLSGIYTERISVNGELKLRMVATDGHRLSMMDKSLGGLEELDLIKGVMIPKKGMLEIKKITSEEGAIQIGFKDKNCVLKKDNSLLVIRLLETKFPDYYAVIPKEEKYSIEINRIAIMDAMKKMLILSNERYKAVKLTLYENTMELVSTNPDLGVAQEILPVNFSGERIEAGFNPQFFIDTCQALESENIFLGFIDNSKPCLIKGPADGGFLGLLMPMKL